MRMLALIPLPLILFVALAVTGPPVSAIAQGSVALHADIGAGRIETVSRQSPQIRAWRERELLVAATLPERARSRHTRTQASSVYSSSLRGQVAAFRLAGVEPDGDPLDQVVLRTRLSPSGGSLPINLIVSSYLENFKPDTTPILPDLLHPGRTAQNLGGFLQGKALLTDDAGNVLYIGSFLAEAFLDNSNHAVTTFYGSDASSRAVGRLKGTFALNRNGSLSGHLTGTLRLSAAARRQLIAHLGDPMKPLKSIISVVTVRPHYYGTPGKHSSAPPLHTGFGGKSASTPSAGTSRRISPWTIAAGAGTILSLLLAGVLYVIERRRAQAVT